MVHLARGGRCGQRPGRFCREGLEQVGDQPPPCLGCRRPGAGDDACVGHQHEDEVLVNEIAAELAGFLGAADQLGESRGGTVTLGLEALRGRESHGQHIGETPV